MTSGLIYVVVRALLDNTGGRRSEVLFAAYTTEAAAVRYVELHPLPADMRWRIDTIFLDAEPEVMDTLDEAA